MARTRGCLCAIRLGGRPPCDVDAPASGSRYTSTLQCAALALAIAANPTSHYQRAQRSAQHVSTWRAPACASPAAQSRRRAAASPGAPPPRTAAHTWPGRTEPPAPRPPGQRRRRQQLWPAQRVGGLAVDLSWRVGGWLSRGGTHRLFLQSVQKRRMAGGTACHVPRSTYRLRRRPVRALGRCLLPLGLRRIRCARSGRPCHQSRPCHLPEGSEPICHVGAVGVLGGVSARAGGRGMADGGAVQGARCRCSRCSGALLNSRTS